MPLTAPALLENLEDAGCDSKFAERFMALEQSGQYREQLRLLSDHRRQLLDRLHYLAYQIEKHHAGEH